MIWYFEPVMFVPKRQERQEREEKQDLSPRPHPASLDGGGAGFPALQERQGEDRTDVEECEEDVPERAR